MQINLTGRERLRAKIHLKIEEPKIYANPKAMKFIVETEQEDDGRWIAEVIDLPGVLVYAQTCEEAINHVQALALRVLAERLENDKTESNLVSISFQAA